MAHSVDESLAKIIDEKDFQKLFQREVQGLLRIHNFLEGQSGAPTMKRFYSCLMEEARELKNFLDDFDARHNRQYAFVTELVLSLVSFSAVGYLVRHVLMRYPRYHLHDDRERFIEYHKSADSLLNLCHLTILSLFSSLRRECVEELGIRMPTDKVDEASFSDLLPRMHLPHNIDDRESEMEAGEAAAVATMFLQFAEEFGSISVSKELEPGAAQEFLSRVCPEDRVRSWEAQVYVLQRKYDTLVKGTSVESREEQLRSLRGHTSMVLHHLEMVRYLMHHLEHMRDGIKDRTAAERLEELVPWDQLIQLLYEFAFGKALRYIEQGELIAREVLSKTTNVLEKLLVVPDGATLHARPASLIVGIVNHHGTPVSLKIGGSSCDAASMIQVMMTLGSHSDEKEITFRGDEKPLRDLELLFEHKLGEDGLDGFPSDLAYLR